MSVHAAFSNSSKSANVMSHVDSAGMRVLYTASSSLFAGVCQCHVLSSQLLVAKLQDHMAIVLSWHFSIDPVATGCS